MLKKKLINLLYTLALYAKDKLLDRLKDTEVRV
jgi:hypothetical protein